MSPFRSEEGDWKLICLRSPLASTFYWVLFCLGFWHVVLVSDPTASPRAFLLRSQEFC